MIKFTAISFQLYCCAHSSAQLISGTHGGVMRKCIRYLSLLLYYVSSFNEFLRCHEIYNTRDIVKEFFSFAMNSDNHSRRRCRLKLRRLITHFVLTL